MLIFLNCCTSFIWMCHIVKGIYFFIFNALSLKDYDWIENNVWIFLPVAAALNKPDIP